MITDKVGYKAKAFELRNLAFFFLISFGLTWFRNALLILGILKQPSGITDPRMLFFVLTTWAPTIAAFGMAAFTEGKAGIKAQWGRFWNLNLSIKWLLVTLFSYPALLLVANLVARTLDGQTYPFLDLPNPSWMIFPLFIGWVIGGLSEEFGWRGYALPRFQVMWNSLTSSIILGAIWAAWHGIQWFVPGNNRTGNFWEWALSIILVSVLITWIFNNTNGSILAAVLFHATLNTPLIWCCGSSSWYLYAVLLIAVLFILIIFGSRNLVRQRPEESAGLEGVRAVGA